MTDCMIAAVALGAGSQFATANEGDFSRFTEQRLQLAQASHPQPPVRMATTSVARPSARSRRAGRSKFSMGCWVKIVG